MKNFFLSLIGLVVLAALVAFTTNGNNNSGRGFYYQAVVRSANGALLAGSDVTLRVSLYPGLDASQPTWSEIHDVHTDNFGSFSITVGHGLRDVSSAVSSYNEVDFRTAHYAMKLEVLENGVFRTINFEMLPCVPYTEVAYNAVSLPAGMIIPFAGTLENIPEGYILCDGRELDRNTYANLYRAIGVSWGVGNGSSTFNAPDLRGRFIRGAACGDTVNDPDWNTRLSNEKGGNNNDVGSIQGFAQPNVTGTFSGVESSVVATGPFYPTSARNFGCGKSDWDNVTIGFDLSRCVPTSTEVRPSNVAVTYIIKY